MSGYDSLYLTGTQQVSVYPYQTLSSVYGNELLYGLFEPGVYDAGISLGDGASSTILRVSIGAGTTLLFKRQHVNPDDATKTDTIIGKITVISPNFIDILKADVWKDVGAYASATKLYVVADWHYGVTASSERYVNFTLETDLSSIEALEGTTSHKLVIATLSNHQWFVDGNGNYSPTNSNLYHYHTSYESQANRNALKRVFARNNNFNLTFAHNGRTITVNPGNAWVGTSLYSLATTASIAPAVGLTSYITSVQTNTSIPIAGVESDYYQVDFLRLKIDENSGASTYGWDSFLVTGTGSGSVDGSTLGWANNSITAQDLLGYVKQFNYPIQGEGFTLLIAVRPRADVPVADGATNILWPENCLILKDQGIESTQVVEAHKRMKIPVWSSSDLGY